MEKVKYCLSNYTETNQNVFSVEYMLLIMKEAIYGYVSERIRE